MLHLQCRSFCNFRQILQYAPNTTNGKVSETNLCNLIAVFRLHHDAVVLTHRDFHCQDISMDTLFCVRQSDDDHRAVGFFQPMIFLMEIQTKCIIELLGLLLTKELVLFDNIKIVHCNSFCGRVVSPPVTFFVKMP